MEVDIKLRQIQYGQDVLYGYADGRIRTCESTKELAPEASTFDHFVTSANEMSSVTIQEKPRFSVILRPRIKKSLSRV